MAARSSSRPPTRSRALKRSRTCRGQNLPAPAGAARRRSRPPRPRCEFLPCEARCHGRSGLRKRPRRAWSGLRSAVVGEDREGSPAMGELGDLLHARQSEPRPGAPTSRFPWPQSLCPANPDCTVAPCLLCFHSDEAGRPAPTIIWESNPRNLVPASSSLLQERA